VPFVPDNTSAICQVGAGAPAAEQTYTNSKFDFSLTYPSDLIVTEYDEGGGTKSIVFQKPNAPVGFEMFITPDDGDDPLTLADIELDFPTLEMEGTERLSASAPTKNNSASKRKSPPNQQHPLSPTAAPASPQPQLLEDGGHARLLPIGDSPKYSS
jgi:hypothetical protein